MSRSIDCDTLHLGYIGQGTDLINQHQHSIRSNGCCRCVGTDLSLELRLHHGGILLPVVPGLGRGHSALRWSREPHVVGVGVHGWAWAAVHPPGPSAQLLHADESGRLSTITHVALDSVLDQHNHWNQSRTLNIF